jgi:Patatin-like phospholipase
MRQARGGPLSLAAILVAEAAAFGTELPPHDPAPEAPSDGLLALHLARNQCGYAALCLSGGGIRSAAFSLGVIQRLAAERLVAAGARRALGEFDYLSTVSGGGYIGAWLSAWLMRADIDAANGIGKGSRDVLGALGDMTGADEAPAIKNVRANSNYLTPKIGAMSADLWADVATYSRNLLLNWLVIAPLIACVVLLVKLLHWGQYAALTMGGAPLVPLWLALAAALLMVVPLSFQTANRPTVRMMNVGQGWFLRLDVCVTLVAALTLSTTLRSLAAAARVFPVLPWGPEVAPAAMFYAACALAGALLYALSWLAAPLWRHFPIGSVAAPRVARSRYDLAAWTIAGAVFGAALGLFQQIETTLVGDSPWFVAVFGVSAVLIARNLGVISFVGLTSAASFSDEDREWFARADGWYTAAAITYFVASGLILFASNIVELVPKYGSEVLAAIGGISGLVTLLIGKSPLTAIDPNETHRSQSGRNRAWALNIATPIFACSLLIAVSAVLDRVLLCMPFTASALWTGDAAHSGNFHPALILGIAAVLATIVEIIAGFYIDINQFSLHALYCDRLVRCFLAASRHDRPYRNLFTDFDRFDNPRMHELLRAQRENGDTDGDKPWRPLHIINAALNVVSTHNLAWQQRKAESFTFSPLHAGSGSVANAGTGSRIGSYRPTEDYGRGIKLGTAMAISGAAVSPNMGYNSSPAVTFFMALFNVRLGWWLGNPGPAGARTFDLKGPRFATRPLIDETFGLTTDTTPMSTFPMAGTSTISGSTRWSVGAAASSSSMPATTPNSTSPTSATQCARSGWTIACG